MMSVRTEPPKANLDLGTANKSILLVALFDQPSVNPSQLPSFSQPKLDPDESLLEPEVKAGLVRCIPPWARTIPQECK